MPEPLKLHTHHNVTIFNKDMLLGGLIGSFLFAAGPIVLGCAIAAGALIGGYTGKKRLQRENNEGKVVTTPSLINKEGIIGALAGAQIGAYLGIAAAAAVIGALVAPELLAQVSAETVAPEIMEKMINPLLAGLGTWATSIASSTAIGGYIGAKAGYKRMEREFDRAVEQQRGNTLTRGAERELEQSHGMEPGKGKDFFQALEQERRTVEQGQTPSR